MAEIAMKMIGTYAESQQTEVSISLRKWIQYIKSSASYSIVSRHVLLFSNVGFINTRTSMCFII